MNEKRSPLRWLLKCSQDSCSGIAILTVCQSVVSVSLIVFALIMKKAIDSAVSKETTDFAKYCLILGIIILIQILLRAVIRNTDENVRSSIENSLKSCTYRTILSRSYASLASFHTGELQNRMTNDTVVIADGAASIFPDLIALMVKLFGALAILVYLDWRFASIFIIGSIVFAVMTYFFRNRLKLLHKRVQEADGNVRSFLQETTGNILILRTFSGEKRAVDKASELMEIHKNERMRRILFSIICNLGFSAVMRGGYLFGLVWCGYGIIKGNISYGTLAAVLQLIGHIQSPVVSMTGYLPKYYSMIASVERLIELEELPEENINDKLSESERDKLYESMKCIKAEGLSFSYPDAPETVLDKAYLTITKGEFVAITGYSGIGKSTFLKTLLGVYKPTAGKISCEISGHEESGSEMYDCDILKRGEIEICEKTRSLFAYVPQGILLLSGKVWETIHFLSEKEPNSDKIEAACKIACADFVYQLRDGVETQIGENGEGLSEGQKQRLAIARAIYSEAPVLLLDEATSALDEATEARLLMNLKHLTDKTVIIVTHKPAALNVCDHVYNLEEGAFSEVR